MKRKNRTGGIRLPDFILYYRAILIKRVWCWQNKQTNKNRNIDQWNRIESPVTNPSTYGQVIYGKGDKNIQGSPFNKWCQENWKAICKRMKLEHSLTPYTKINSKWIKNLNIRNETIKLSEENIGRTLLDRNCGIFWDLSPQAKEIKAKINKWDLNKLKRFCPAKETIDKMKR